MPEGETVESLQVTKSKVGLVLGLPMNRPNVPREWALAMATMSWPLNTTIMHLVISGRPIDEARELICETALEANAPYIWFIDDDTVPPHTAIRYLISGLEQHPTAIACGGIYCERREPTSPIVYKDFGIGPFWDWTVGEVFEVQGIGTGCLVVRTAMLREIPKPWFRTVDVAVDSPGGLGLLQTTDDMYFCKKAVKAGYKLLAHGAVLCDHYDISSGQVYRLPKDSRPYKSSQQTEGASS